MNGDGGWDSELQAQIDRCVHTLLKGREDGSLLSAGILVLALHQLSDAVLVWLVQGRREDSQFLQDTLGTVDKLHAMSRRLVLAAGQPSVGGTA